MDIMLNENLSIMQHKLIQALKDFDYRLKRYQINYSIAMGHSPEDLDLSLFSDYIRTSDRFIILNHNTCAVIFDCTNDETGIKAANNLLIHFQTTFFSAPIFASVVTASNYDSTVKMLPDLFYLLNYAIDHNMNGIILEHSQVIQHQQSV